MSTRYKEFQLGNDVTHAFIWHLCIKVVGGLYVRIGNASAQGSLLLVSGVA